VLRPVSPRIAVEGLAKRYGQAAALQGVTVDIEPGEFVAIIGRSGAGKTTFLRCLSGAVPPSEGRIGLDGEDLASLAAQGLRRHRARVGMIYQQFNLVRRLRVLDNVLVGRLPHLGGWRRLAALAWRFDAHESEIALRCLAHVGLVDRAWQRTDTLSGGEQQRVAIAKILAQDPALILADEPIASLDVVNGALVMETLRRVASESGLTVIATLHHMELALRYADRILGFRAGTLVFDGPPAALDEAAAGRVFGQPATVVAPPAAAALGQPEWAVS
jgi:phosphonate transport system ATP-binding protein